MSLEPVLNSSMIHFSYVNDFLSLKTIGEVNSFFLFRRDAAVSQFLYVLHFPCLNVERIGSQLTIATRDTGVSSTILNVVTRPESNISLRARYISSVSHYHPNCNLLTERIK